MGWDNIERRRAEQQVNKLLHEQQVILNNPIVSMVKVRNRTIVWANRGYESMFGYGREELNGASSRRLYLSQADYEEMGARAYPIIQAGGCFRGEYRFRRKDGQVIWADVSSAMLNPETGETLWAFSDITERKRIEAELEQHRRHLEELVQQRTAALVETEARASHILESSADGLYGVDAGGYISFINPAACTLLGYRPEQVIGRSAHELFHHSKLDGTPYPFEGCPSHLALKRGQAIRVDTEVYWHADGHPVSVMYAVHPMLQNGSITGAVTSFVDISTQRAAAQAQEQALIAAEHLARTKSQFLANMSHEIRTPLNGVLGFAQIGYRNCQDSEKARNAFANILNSGSLLRGVIDDILDFSKIDADKLSVERVEVSLAEVTGHGLELVRERAQAKHLDLRTELAPDLPKTCLGDPLRLRQVLLNLLSNAIKFTEQGCVTLSVSHQDGKLIFRVMDTGIGMNQEQIALLFNPFQQADGSTTRKFGGTGLGLAISQRIVQLMGGNIRAESQAGVGSNFEFSIPYAPIEVPAARQAPAPAVGMAGDAKPLAGISILAAEDNVVNQMVLEDNLIEFGARVVMVGNGREAVERVIRDGLDAYDVVLMDVKMPEMDGHEATRRILKVAPNLPVIGQTAHTLKEEQEQCRAAGMVGYISKPIDPTALAQLVLQHVRSD